MILDRTQNEKRPLRPNLFIKMTHSLTQIVNPWLSEENKMQPESEVACHNSGDQCGVYQKP